MGDKAIFGFDYEHIQGQHLVSILGNGALTLSDGRTGFDNLCLCLTNALLSVSVDPNTDEIILALESGLRETRKGEWINVAILDRYVGLELGWLWQARNWMGYADMLAISFAGIEPDVAVVGSASKLHLYSIVGL